MSRDAIGAKTTNSATNADAVGMQVHGVAPSALRTVTAERAKVLRINAVRALADKRVADVDPLCQKWLRRFASHVRAPDVLLIQANALYLAGEKDRAKEIWKGLVEKSAATDAGRRAKAALDQL